MSEFVLKGKEPNIKNTRRRDSQGSRIGRKAVLTGRGRADRWHLLAALILLM
jgi:hypothetical protein